eukprot:2686971-Pyramimonas_sp.AAC.1
MFITSKHVREYIKTIPATTLELKHHWATRALRGWRFGRIGMIGDAIKAYPTLGMHFDMSTFRCTN